MTAFKAYDFRGIFNKDFTLSDVYRIGFFLPGLLQTEKILVGRDVRTSSDAMFAELTRGITDAGADVYDIGLATTPMVYFGTAVHHFKASVQITASHNPREYNGMKISRENALPVGYDTGLAELEKKVLQSEVKPLATKGVVHPFDIRGEYLVFLRKYLSDLSQLRISIDCSNGMAALLIKELLGDHPMYIFDKLDGTFPNHEANPLVMENVQDLIQHVVNHHSDVGVIFDGDADRVMFVDEKGQFISPDLIIAVLAHYFLKDTRGNVLQDIRTSKSVGEYIEKMGSTMHMWRVGRAYAAPKLREINGLFGGEYAGHYYFRDFFYSDSGIMACLIALNVFADMKKQGISVSRLIENISSYESTGEVNFKLERKQEAMDAIRKHFLGREPVLKSVDFDGYRCDFSDWWFNVRLSNTEPYLRFIAEARDRQKLDQVLAEARKIIESFQ